MSNNIEQKAFEWLNQNQLSYDIWDKKYRFNNETFDQWLDRVSGKDPQVKQLILEKKFIFGGRILANRGTQHIQKVTFSNCYVVPPVEDSIEGIYETCAQLARTYSYGGGCGVDISKLRPAGAEVKNSAKTTSGAVSFMSTFDEVTKVIGQNGRRAALMLSLDVNHPDVQEFVNIKTDLQKVTSANISIRVSDDFMQAVENNADYILHWPCGNDKIVNIAKGELVKNPNSINYNILYPITRFIDPNSGNEITGYIKRIKAKELFATLCQNNWNYAEPGILYWDRITSYNLMSSNPNFQYAGVNPCAEEPLPAGGSCLLGSLNLAAFVEGNSFNKSLFADSVQKAVEALNTVLMEGLNLHPLNIQKYTVNKYRQIGLGIMGLADVLIKLKIRYGSPEAIKFCDNIGDIMAQNAIVGSSMIDDDGTSFSCCVDSSFYQAHLETKYQLSNSQLLTIAPTGSISTMWNISGGIEPIFAKSYTRTTKSLHDKDVVYTVYPKIIQDYMKEHNIVDIKDLPDWFVSSEDIKPEDRLKMQAIWQTHIDASISSTVNLPEESTIDDVYNIYMQAWKLGLKGVTIYRANCARQAILSSSNKQDKTPTVAEKEETRRFNNISPVSRKTMGTTYGATHCKKCACGTLYITTNMDKEGNLVELFTHTSKGGICQANLAAVTRMISLGLRSGLKIDEIEDQLKGIHCPACQLTKAKGNHVDGMSCPDIMAKTIREFLTNEIKPCINSKKEQQTTTKTQDKQTCPECGSTIMPTNGCWSCQNCGWSKCN